MKEMKRGQANPVESLNKLGKDIVKQLDELKNPDVILPVRTLSNIYFDDKSKIIQLGDKISHRTYLNVAHTRKFMQTLLVAAECKKIIEQNVTTSIRDLYYAVKHTIPGTQENTVEEQSESDPVLEDLEAALNTLREQLHLQADRKGHVAGPIVVNDVGDDIDATRMGSSGWAIPSNVEPETVKFKSCSADYVLVIEKDAVWQRLNEDKFWRKQNCLILTSKGQPARGARRLINRLHTELKLPIYVLTDGDVWGYYIYSVIKQGSINLSFLSDRLGMPEAKFIGLTTQDVKKFGIPGNVTIKLNQGDVKRANEMLNYVWFKPKEWQQEINHMLKVGYKLELEALSAKGIKFISESYLPQKIGEKDFLP
ncbi:MAG: DNA topoisomerase IV subunit A [Candidatus Aenigmarchaeota archaeon]|nr:DNA topoisomerase IV subunit A [Candidatus Aenigmarchaeota archaeon]